MASRNAKKHEQTQWEIKFFEVRRSPDALKTINHHWGPRVPWPASRAGKPTSQVKVLKVSKLAKVSKVPKMSKASRRGRRIFGLQPNWLIDWLLVWLIDWLIDWQDAVRGGRRVVPGVTMNYELPLGPLGKYLSGGWSSLSRGGAKSFETCWKSIGLQKLKKA